MVGTDMAVEKTVDAAVMDAATEGSNRTQRQAYKVLSFNLTAKYRPAAELICRLHRLSRLPWHC